MEVEVGKHDARRRKRAAYLKIHQFTEDAIKCFRHWADICHTLEINYYVVCDNAELEARIRSGAEAGQEQEHEFIPSRREDLREICADIIEERWKNAAYALLTPFLHAKEQSFDYIWNIDADDTIMYAEPEVCAEILSKAEECAVSQRLDLFSFDMWYSRTSFNGLPHWSFGVLFANMSADYFSIIREAKFLAESAGYSAHPLNLDNLFSFIRANKMLNCETFCCENLWFEHFGFGLSNFKDGVLRCYTNMQAQQGNVEEDCIPIAPDVVKIDVGLTEAETARESSLRVRERIIGQWRLFGIDADLLKQRLGDSNKLVLFGAGASGRQVLSMLRDEGCEVSYFCDNAEWMWGTFVNDVSVISPAELGNLYSNGKICVLITCRYAGEIRRQLEETGIKYE